GERLALPGLTDPAQGASLAPAWGALGEYLGGLSRAGWTVIADCGRLASGFPPWPLLRQADLVLLALRPRSIATISPAVPAVAHLRRELGDTGPALGLLLIGGGLPGREVARHLMVPVAAELAWDERTAAALSGLGKGRRRGPLMRSAASAHRSLSTALAAHRATQAQLFLQPVVS
ncbi:MAG: ParA family protein, partial [Hamadaea sp.]|nr:ParA family protein [Hamadaea sp.]